MAGAAPVNLAGAVAPRGGKPLEAALRRVTEISTLPHIALRVMEVARDPKSCVTNLKTVVEADPAMSARVLRLVNSAACGVRVTVTNLQQAISFLGFNQVRNLAMTASVSEVFREGEKIGEYERGQLWRHLVAVGVCARMIALRCRLPNFDDAFLAGLLHDIGIILEDQVAHEEFAGAILQLQDGMSLCDAETATLGFNHAQFGERVAEMWKFPAATRAAIRFHHASALYHGDEIGVVRCVELANVLCTLRGFTSVGRKLLAAPTDACRGLGLGKDDILVLAKDLDEELARNETLFEL